MSPCEQALVTSTAADALPDGTPQLRYYMTLRSVPLAWIDVAAQCSDRFAEGTLRNAQTKQALATLAGKFGQSAPEVTAARLDGVTSLDIQTSALDAMAVAEDRAGFAMEVLAAQGKTAGATLRLGDMHKTASQQLVSLAEKGASSTSSTSSASSTSSTGQSHADPRQKVYAVDALLANPVTIPDKASGLTVPTAAAIEMDCARTEIAAVADTESKPDADTLMILSALAAKHAYTAMQLGYPATDAALFE
ncbi:MULTISPECIES: hypothetical protein [Bifidobacterium]|uniref:Uncharacterized protein n=1 Tax=Bifidobacterium reuteri DSM 23975 TaxID=1437610 RepID=A0A087CZ22_9BIFI|nr:MULTISPECIES: hypothetical protein [Bifidobacterium]KFI88522.1 hypothetical protein BREU_0643 [Bifidobacterium reuteri DSM 23975]TPF78899.1 hypothetical protein BW09_01090 [Bifidobacterium sp. UTCIF-1]TPF79636.1 hypothetical protein BW08_09100 [Bifidobacterium sp. UTCIF-24]TPF82800.1 hypothetical protein BW12_02025 [Bifidobacterium sp. UTCIF-3]TPF83849.1 hypothetical protein BW07_08230 [Bifidobacterium sp. UTCIF-36]